MLQATILYGNTGLYANNSTFPEASGSFASVARNLIGTTNGSTGWTASDLINIDPKLGPLQDNGGLTLTYALLNSSPAIDAGVSSGGLVDGRGQLRTIDIPNILNLPGSDGTDIGATEVDPVLRATSVERSGNDILVRFTSVSDKSYVLEYKSKLNTPVWTPLSDFVQGSGGIATARHVGGAVNPTQFYRIRTR